MTHLNGTRTSRLLIGTVALVAIGAAPLQARATSVEGAVTHQPVAAQQTAKFPAGTVMMLHRKTVQVALVGYAFSPAVLAVSPGTKVVWTNKDAAPHTVTEAKNAFTSLTMNTGDHYSHTFAKTGTFKYICAVHPFMHGMVIVSK